MSNFNKMLGMLQESVKLARNNESVTKRKTTMDSNETVSQEINMKTSNPTTSKRRRIFHAPPDKHLLTVNIAFLCIGAQKAGTTWMHNMLRKFDELALPSQKELHFFDWNRKRGLDWYSQQFPSSESGKLCGEITPCYAVLQEEKIREIFYLFPKVKIIFMARDIVDRAWSALLMELRTSALGLQPGEFPTNESLLRPFEKEKYLKVADPDRYDDDYFLNRLMHTTHSSRNDYAKSLRSWMRIFPKENFLIVNYNDLSSRPKSLVNEVLKFIGVNYDGSDDVVSENDVHKRYNTTMEPNLKRPLRPSLEEKMKKYLEPNIASFNELLNDLGYEWRL